MTRRLILPRTPYLPPTDPPDFTPEPPSFTGLVGSWRFIDNSFNPDRGEYKDNTGNDNANEPTHDTLTFGSDESFMRVEKQYAYDATAVVPHPYPDPEADSIPDPVMGVWLELPDPFPFTLEGATYEVTTEADPPVSQVTIRRVTTEGVAEVKASVTCNFEIVTAHHTPPIRYLTLADCEGDANVHVLPDATENEDAFELLAEGVPRDSAPGQRRGRTVAWGVPHVSRLRLSPDLRREKNVENRERGQGGRVCSDDGGPRGLRRV